MKIEVKGIRTFHNAGAELMLRSIAKEVSTWPEPIQLVEWPSLDTIRKRHELKLELKLWIPRIGTMGGIPLPGRKAIPKSIRRLVGAVDEEDIDAVFDGSGYAYQGKRNIVKFSHLARRYKEHGKKLILLPQAFGPFADWEAEEAMRSIIEAASLVFARDEKSAEYLVTVAGEQDKILISPDFTIAFDVEGDYVNGLPDGYLCLIPNIRMIRDTLATESEYLSFLSYATKSFCRYGLDVVILAHDRADLQICKRLSQDIKGVSTIVKPRSAVQAKAVIGNAKVVVGSRFHGLVSALSQGVPAIGTSWSHKYEALFADFGCSEMVLSPSASESDIDQAVDRAMAGTSRDLLITILTDRSNVLRKRVAHMWKIIRDTLEISEEA